MTITAKAVHVIQVLLSNMPGIHIKTFSVTEDYIFFKQRRGVLEVSELMH